MLEAAAPRVGEHTSELPLSGVVTSTRLGPVVPAVSLCTVAVTVASGASVTAAIMRNRRYPASPTGDAPQMGYTGRPAR
jgi:hypothetical protein